MVSEIHAQRRVEMKALQIESAAERDRAGLRTLAKERHGAEITYAKAKVSFEAAKKSLLTGFASAARPKQRLEAAIGQMEVLRKEKRETSSAKETLRGIAERVQENARQLELKNQQLEALSERAQAIGLRTRSKLESLDQENSEEVRSARHPPQQNLILESARAEPLLNPSMSRVVTPGVFSERIKELQSQDCTAHSRIELQFSAEGGARIGVELIRKGDRSLEVRLLPGGQGEGRRLWRTREDIKKALTEAGYSVQRFIIGGA